MKSLLFILASILVISLVIPSYAYASRIAALDLSKTNIANPTLENTTTTTTVTKPTIQVQNVTVETVPANKLEPEPEPSSLKCQPNDDFCTEGCEVVDMVCIEGDGKPGKDYYPDEIPLSEVSNKNNDDNCYVNGYYVCNNTEYPTCNKDETNEPCFSERSTRQEAASYANPDCREEDAHESCEKYADDFGYNEEDSVIDDE